MEKKQSHVQACEDKVMDTIRRLVSTRGGESWEYNVRAGKVTVT